MWLTSGDSGSPALVKPRELSDNSRENGEDEHSRPGFLCPVESLNADSVFPCDHSATPDEIFERLPDSWFTLNKKGERVLSDGYKGSCATATATQRANLLHGWNAVLVPPRLAHVVPQLRADTRRRRARHEPSRRAFRGRPILRDDRTGIERPELDVRQRRRELRKAPRLRGRRARV